MMLEGDGVNKATLHIHQNAKDQRGGRVGLLVFFPRFHMELRRRLPGVPATTPGNFLFFSYIQMRF